MKNLLMAALAGVILTTTSGCASIFGSFPKQHNTNVILSKKNFKVIKFNAVGTSCGFTLLCFPLAVPRYSEAMADMYNKVNLHTGQPIALTNVTEEIAGRNFILFGLPSRTIRADIIEFTSDK